MRSPALANWLLLILLACIWGTSFILIKTGLTGFPPLQLASLRISISCLALTPLIPFYYKKVKKQNWKYIFLVGIFGSGIPPFMYAIAQTKIASAIAGIINSSVPLFTFIIGVLFFSAIFSMRRLAGVLIGLAGAIILVFYGVENPNPETYSFAGLILLATICYAISVNVVKRYLQEVHAVAITVFSFLMIGWPTLIYLFTTDFFVRVQQEENLLAFGAVAVLAVVGTALANVLFFNLTQRTSALFASTVTYLIPIVAVFWGIGAGEAIGIIHFFGMILILAGVYLAGNRKIPFVKPVES